MIPELIDQNRPVKKMRQRLRNVGNGRPRRSTSSYHIISPDSALSETAIADTCLLHPSKQLTLFCTDCQVSCCVDCTKTDHCNHRLMALEVANQEMRRRYESLTGKIDTVNKLVRDFDVDIAKIANLKREGERHCRLGNRPTTTPAGRSGQFGSAFEVVAKGSLRLHERGSSTHRLHRV